MFMATNICQIEENGQIKVQIHLCMVCRTEILHLSNFIFVDQKPFTTLDKSKSHQRPEITAP